MGRCIAAIDGTPHAQLRAAKVQLWGALQRQMWGLHCSWRCTLLEHPMQTSVQLWGSLWGGSYGSYGRIHQWGWCPTSLWAPCVCNALCCVGRAAVGCPILHQQRVKQEELQLCHHRGQWNWKGEAGRERPGEAGLHCSALHCTARSCTWCLQPHTAHTGIEIGRAHV